ncbi:unnamed protein product [Euphydryas editha]|uniref:Salivary secreted peptide n=1 Tax=Euphydryas editha TaxID=104508 RepID=A0AAU9TCT5_EUPED|nr:unnamed protein product [Euphydryas editha]
MKFEAILFMLLTIALLVKSEHLIIGNSAEKELVYYKKVKYHAIPFVKRVKQVFYNSTDQRPIDAITVYDNLNSSASAVITAGGLGYTYVNLQLKSERGEALHYDVGIYSYYL